MAILVSEAVEEVNSIPMLGFDNDIVEVVIADPEPTKNSVTINKTFFSFKDLYFLIL